MIFKPSLVSPIAIAYFAISSCLISPSLISQDLSIYNSSSEKPAPSSEVISNLITNNPFVAESNELGDQPKSPPGPKSAVNKSQVLQKYLQFKSIAIINKKKYFSIFNKRTNKSFWISEGETVDNFRVTYYNQKSNAISITDGINSEVISIITANETPLSVVNGPTNEKVGQDVAMPKLSEAKANQNKEKPKTLPRRRVIPVKR